MKYRKKPVVVEATQWFPGRADPDIPGVHPPSVREEAPEHYVITIHNQRVYLKDGDWIITEPDGIHHYPCKPDIFAATYEPVEV